MPRSPMRRYYADLDDAVETAILLATGGAMTFSVFAPDGMFRDVIEALGGEPAPAQRELILVAGVAMLIIMFGIEAVFD